MAVSLRQLQMREEAIERQEFYRRRAEDHFARREVKKKRDEEQRRQHLDAVKRYLDAESPTKAQERKKNEALVRRLMEEDRHEGRQTLNALIGREESEALVAELAENRRKSLTMNQKKAVEHNRARRTKSLVAQGHVEQMKLGNEHRLREQKEAEANLIKEYRRNAQAASQARMEREKILAAEKGVARRGSIEYTRLHKLQKRNSEKEAEASAIKEYERNSKSTTQTRAAREKHAEAEKKLARRTSLDAMRLHKLQKRNSEKEAEANLIKEYRRNAQAASQARMEREKILAAEKGVARRGSIEYTRLHKLQKRNSEKEAEASAIKEYEQASEVAKIRKQTEEGQRRERLRAAREERMEMARQARQRKLMEAAALGRESSLRSYGGLMAFPGEMPEEMLKRSRCVINTARSRRPRSEVRSRRSNSAPTRPRPIPRRKVPSSSSISTSPIKKATGRKTPSDDAAHRTTSTMADVATKPRGEPSHTPGSWRAASPVTFIRRSLTPKGMGQRRRHVL